MKLNHSLGASLICLAGIFYLSCHRGGNNQPPAPPELNKASLANFILRTPGKASSEAAMELRDILDSASRDSILFHRAVQFLETPLSNPNSRFRNEGLHILLLQTVLRSPWYDSLNKIVPAHDLHLALQNRPGNPANDFVYVTADGAKANLYALHADYTLILFFNPECPACKDAKAALLNSAAIKKNLATGKLKLLAVYTDTDLALWTRHQSDIPSSWINAHDLSGELYTKGIYDLKAIPSMYLLDKNKIVLLKDCAQVPVIEQRLMAAH